MVYCCLSWEKGRGKGEGRGLFIDINSHSFLYPTFFPPVDRHTPARSSLQGPIHPNPTHIVQETIHKLKKTEKHKSNQIPSSRKGRENKFQHSRHHHQDLLIGITDQHRRGLQPLRPRLLHHRPSRPGLPLVQRRDPIEVDLGVEARLHGRGEVVRVRVRVVVAAVAAAVGVGVGVGVRHR